MKKILFLSILLILTNCSSEKEKRKWRNHLKEETINGVKNPYMIDDYVYKYWAINDDMVERGGFTESCGFDIYTLKPSIKQEKLEKYLNQFNSEKLAKKMNNNPNVLFVFEDKSFETKWFTKSKITKKLFEPFEKKETYHNQSMYDRYNECLNFFQDNTQAFAKKYHLNFHEEVKHKGFSKKKIIDIINTPETLVKVTLWQFSSGTVFFYDAKQQYLVHLHFQPN